MNRWNDLNPRICSSEKLLTVRKILDVISMLSLTCYKITDIICCIFLFTVQKFPSQGNKTFYCKEIHWKSFLLIWYSGTKVGLSLCAVCINGPDYLNVRKKVSNLFHSHMTKRCCV